ncbi:MAG: hypothetical protein KDE25_04010 [Novosphingobium sp.]|nr:hypothetical protein [Novosphingobium sp.]
MTQNRNFALLFAAILLVAVVLRFYAFSLFDTIHHDEVLQYQERAFRMVFGQGIIPWEQRYGIRNALIPHLLAGPMWLAAQFTSAPYVPLVTARIVFAGLCLGIVPAAYWIGSLASRLHGVVAMFSVAVWFEAVIFGVSVLSETIAATFALAGTAAILRAKDSAKAALFAGFLLALSALLRLQYAAYGAMLMLLVTRTDWNLWRRLILGAVPALLIGAISDVAAGTVPYAWIVRNVSMNIGEGRASSYGTNGPLDYAFFFLFRAFPVGPLLLVGAFLSGKAFRPVLWSALFLVLAHSVIDHKEYRFIHLAVMALTILSAIGWTDIVLKRLASERARILAVALLCAAWLALSAFALHKIGGPNAIRDGGETARAAIAAAEDPKICGIAVPENERKDIATVYMPRPMPLFLVTNPMNEGKKPFDPEALAAFNALILTGDVTAPAPFTRKRCVPSFEVDTGQTKQVCLYVRKAPCTISTKGKAYTYQQYYLDRDW